MWLWLRWARNVGIVLHAVFDLQQRRLVGGDLFVLQDLQHFLILAGLHHFLPLGFNFLLGLQALRMETIELIIQPFQVLRASLYFEQVQLALLHPLHALQQLAAHLVQILDDQLDVHRLGHQLAELQLQFFHQVAAVIEYRLQ